MASKTYKTRALVLKKTKLGEKDLIVTLLDESGALAKGVAKGARKPGGSLAARLELFSVADMLMAKGRTLDVVCEAHLVDAGAADFTLEQSACAAPIAELLSLITQPELSQPRLFDMARAAFAHIAGFAGEPACALSITASCLWKIMAQSGFRPSFSSCVLCGRDVLLDGKARVPVSLVDGGAVCEQCRKPADAIMVGAACVQWCEALIGARFDDVCTCGIETVASFDVLHLARAWVRTHTGRDLKSLDFLFTSGLF